MDVALTLPENPRGLAQQYKLETDRMQLAVQISPFISLSGKKQKAKSP